MTDDTNDNLQPFDFRSPCRLPVHVEGKLLDWQVRGSKLLPQKWFPEIDLLTSWDTTSPETVACSQTEFPKHFSVFRIDLEGIDKFTLLSIPGDLALALVQCMLGANAEGMEEPRPITSIERSLVEILMTLMVQALNESAKGTGYPELTFRGHEADPNAIRLFPMDTELVLLKFNVNGPFGSGTIQWMWPESTADELFDVSSDTFSESDSTQLRELLLNAEFDLSVELGSTSVDVKELATLKEGDILVFDQRISDPLKCKIGKSIVYTAWPTSTGRQQSIQIEPTE